MQKWITILTVWICIAVPQYVSYCQDNGKNISFNFYGDPVSFRFPQNSFVNFDPAKLSEASVQGFYDQVEQQNFSSLLAMMKGYKNEKSPDDWLFYQLVRRTAESISPKADNYLRYTLYKWYFMIKAGYGTMLSQNNGRLLFYIQCDENIYNIPYKIKNGLQYVCLNYHDYGGNIDFEKEPFAPLMINLPEFNQTFSYKISKLPDFNKTDYVNKKLQFSYYANEYNFNIKINPQIKSLFNNYPVVEYKDYLNIPLSNETYSSLITLLKKQIKGLNAKNGVDYLMHFTRYALAFDADTEAYGSEKRLSPEQTLLFQYSDCEDRVGLFFFLVKEIYNLPMIVLAYPRHVTIAVRFEKPIGNTIEYNGAAYSVCEPTPQRTDLKIGQLLPELQKESYKVAYAYDPH